MRLTNIPYVYLLAAQTLSKGSQGSSVWGVKGEKWDKELLLDWSWSGYGAKEREYPDPPVVANVLDFGAKGDGKTDNSGPFAAAIAAARGTAGGGTVLIPAGQYMVRNRIILNGNGIVLKGAGRENTKILFPESLAALDGHGTWRAFLEEKNKIFIDTARMTWKKKSLFPSPYYPHRINTFK